MLPCPVTSEIRRQIVHKVSDINLAYGTNISALIVSEEEWQNAPLSLLPIHTFIEEEGVFIMKKKDTNMSSLISKLVDRLKEKYQPEKIILYGSYAYGMPNEASDIDLLIIKDTTDRPIDRRIIVRRLVSDIRKKVPFSSIVVTPEELFNRLEIGDDFFVEIMNKGRVVYER